MILPNFMVIGAAKSGTTSLMQYLGQHPEVFVPSSKEPNFFALSGQQDDPKGPASPHILKHLLYNWSRTDFDQYKALFAGADKAKAIGEGSVRYLYFPQAPKRIKAILPSVRVIVILRHPVDRLYSHYNMNRQNQLEPLELQAALDAEDDRVALDWGWDWHYRRVSSYGEQLQRWFGLFPKDQIQVHLYDDFVADPLTVFSKICNHIGISEDFKPDMNQRGMVSTFPRNLWLDRKLNWPSRVRYRLLRPPTGKIVRPIMKQLHSWNSIPVPKLGPKLRKILRPIFSEDMALLSNLLERDLPW